MIRRPLRRPSFWLLLLTLLFNATLALQPARYWAAFGLLWILPGIGYAVLLARRPQGPEVEDAVIGLGLGVGTVAWFTLLIHYVPGPLPSWLLLAAVDILLVGLIGARLLLAPKCERAIEGSSGGSSIGSRLRTISWGVLARVIVLSGLLRLVHLGYSEFQGV